MQKGQDEEVAALFCVATKQGNLNSPIKDEG